jgi:hypothetical protein
MFCDRTQSLGGIRTVSNWARSLAVNFVEFYSGHVRRKSRLVEDFRGFPQFLQARRQDNISIKSQPLPFKSFPIHLSFIALRFCDAVRAVKRPTNRQERGSHSTALRAPADGPTQTPVHTACSSAQSPPGFCTDALTNKFFFLFILTCNLSS